MRILAIETSSRRGSVALVEDGRAICTLEHDAPNAHAERMLDLVSRAFATAQWPKSSLDRVAVGIGPGSFTGLRIGIALGQGIALGLGRPIVGVGSLEAMARAVPTSVPGPRWPIIDARRGEVFAAAYDEAGAERAAPRAFSRSGPFDSLRDAAPGEPVLIGEVAHEVAEAAGPSRFHPSAHTELPHALWVAIAAAEKSTGPGGVEPLYIRPVDAIEPRLPPSPLR